MKKPSAEFSDYYNYFVKITTKVWKNSYLSKQTKTTVSNQTPLTLLSKHASY
jgi:hypothetical protein